MKQSPAPTNKGTKAGRMQFITELKQKYGIDLNEQQQAGIRKIAGPSLLLSVPGGGKTTVIVARCAHMVLHHGIAPKNILTLSFSKASARDMKRRFEAIFGEALAQEMRFSTIHSFCYTVMQQYLQRVGRPKPRILEGDESTLSKVNMLKKIVLDKTGEYLGEERMEELSNSISFVKNSLLSSEKMAEGPWPIEQFIEVYDAYEREKRHQRVIDYDDLLSGVYTLFKQGDPVLSHFRDLYAYINVDESQDTSYIQHEMIRYLAAPNNNLFMVGDEDQSIYGFRAAFPKALMDYDKTYPGATILKMERNYRSTGHIVQIANGFIRQNKERYDKQMFTKREAGNPAVFTQLEEKKQQALHVAETLKKEPSAGQAAVLFRNHISAIPFIDEFIRQGIAFSLRDKQLHFFGHWLVKDIQAFLRLALDPGDKEAFRQIYYKMDAYLTKKMVEGVLQPHQKVSNLWDSLGKLPDIGYRERNTLKNLAGNFKVLAALPPLEALGFVEATLGYGKFLKKLSKQAGYSRENNLLLLDTLKILAEKHSSLQAFLEVLVSLQAEMLRMESGTAHKKVLLSTIHAAKGLEFDTVFIPDMAEGQFPSAKSIGEASKGNREAIEEEVRLFYVGMTRARRHLEILSYATSHGRKWKPSRFMKRLSTLQLEAAKSEFAVDTQLTHSIFGVGKIARIRPEKDLLEVIFGDGIKKTLSLQTCLENALIQKFPNRL